MLIYAKLNGMYHTDDMKILKNKKLVYINIGKQKESLTNHEVQNNNIIRED